jgi:hypothetical protein
MPTFAVWFLGQTEHRMFHGVPVIFECPVEDVGYEEISIRMMVGGKLSSRTRLSLSSTRLLE